MGTKMSKAEREEFLAQPWVGVLSIPDEGRGPLAVPVWYNYTPGGEVHIWTGGMTRKADLLRKAGRASLVAQDPTAPYYKYVSVEGPVTLQPVDYERDVVPLAERYYPPEIASKYLASIGGQIGLAGDLLVVLRPQRWLTVDYSKVAG